VRTIQYTDGAGNYRLAVVSDVANGPALDVSTAIAEAGFHGDLVGAIELARHRGLDLFSALSDLAVTRATPTELDLDTGVVGSGGEQRLAPPVAAPEIWAAGVSYRRSREARESESGPSGNAIYRKVYEATRPELFMKDAALRRTVPHCGHVAIRSDSRWSVPEPELALILSRTGEIVAYTIANDVSARDIEAENPLYLPQAKIYSSSCALGPCALIDDGTPRAFEINLRILASDGEILYEGRTSTRRMRRSFKELISYLLLDNAIGDGTVLLTGTGIVPPDDFSLQDGQVVEIGITDIGVLRNPVRRHQERALAD
jgi:2-dehydro-3-deoxy-D-arabinonate dehydratase